MKRPKAVCVIGLDRPEYSQIREALNVPVIAHETLPKILVREGELFVERRNGPGMVPVSKVIYHGIFEDDLEFLAGLVLWGGPVYPNARGMMDCRMKIPCLARALDCSVLNTPPRGYVSAGLEISGENDAVLKWGNWHCGENKMRVNGKTVVPENSILEPFLEGESVRIAMVGDHAWQVKLEGSNWLKSIHDESARFMEIDEILLEDTKTIASVMQLDMIGVDYIVHKYGTRHLLEVNHIPNVTRFPEMWEAFKTTVIDWVNSDE